MKLLVLSSLGVLGGAERTLLDLFRYIKREAADVSVRLLAATDGLLCERARSLGVDVRVLTMPADLRGLGDASLGGPGATVRALLELIGGAPSALQYVRALRREIGAFSPDVIHSNGFKTHVLAALAAPRHVPVIWHLHDFVTPRPLMSRTLQLLRPFAKRAIANSASVAGDARVALGSLPVDVIHNAVDLEVFSPGPRDGAWLDRLAGLPEAPASIVRIGLVATYAHWKGHAHFLAAAARLEKQLPGAARFYVVGGPLYQSKASQLSRLDLEKMILEKELTGHVGLIGFQENLAPVYRSLDVFVHASTRPEPFGLTIAEAMACGRPCIVTAAGGAAELFTHLESAVGVAINDEQSLTDALVLLVRDAALRSELGAKARSRALSQFSPARFGRECVGVYRSL